MADAATFDIFETMSGATYPEDTLTVYLDQKSAYEARVLEVRAAGEADPEKADELSAQRDALVAKVKASALTFTMRGVPTEVSKAIGTKVNAEYGVETPADKQRDKEQALADELIAVHIVKVARADGAEDSRVWDREAVATLRSRVHAEDVHKFLDLVSTLTLEAAYFENVEISPDFS